MRAAIYRIVISLAATVLVVLIGQTVYEIATRPTTLDFLLLGEFVLLLVAAYPAVRNGGRIWPIPAGLAFLLGIVISVVS